MARVTGHDAVRLEIARLTIMIFAPVPPFYRSVANDASAGLVLRGTGGVVGCCPRKSDLTRLSKRRFVREMTPEGAVGVERA